MNYRWPDQNSNRNWSYMQFKTEQPNVRFCYNTRGNCSVIYYESIGCTFGIAIDAVYLLECIYSPYYPL